METLGTQVKKKVWKNKSPDNCWSHPGFEEIGAGEEIAFARSGCADVQTSSSGSLTGRIVRWPRPLGLCRSAEILLRISGRAGGRDARRCAVRSNCVLISSLMDWEHEKARTTAGVIRAFRTLERVKRFELSTSTLARSRSTTELHPHCMGERGGSPCLRGGYLHSDRSVTSPFFGKTRPDEVELRHCDANFSTWYLEFGTENLKNLHGYSQ